MKAPFLSFSDRKGAFMAFLRRVGPGDQDRAGGVVDHGLAHRAEGQAGEAAAATAAHHEQLCVAGRGEQGGGRALPLDHAPDRRRVAASSNARPSASSLTGDPSTPTTTAPVDPGNASVSGLSLAATGRSAVRAVPSPTRRPRPRSAWWCRRVPWKFLSSRRAGRAGP
jgi:hypothetical protein